jgi:hypothetical protein
MSRRAREEASKNYISLGFAFLALLMCAVAAILPYWITFAPEFAIGWIARQWGLLKVSGKYTNLLMTGADIAWFDIRDSVCGASAAYTTMSTGSSTLGLASALGNALTGSVCPPSCKQHLTDRCMRYYQMTYLNLGIFGALIVGCLMGLIGAAMPLIGKERKKDRSTWMLIDLGGFILCAASLVGFYFYYETAFASLRTTSWFQMHRIGWCFWMAVGGTVCLLVPVIIQATKISAGDEKKKDDSQLLTSGASPDFMMPSNF